MWTIQSVFALLLNLQLRAQWVKITFDLLRAQVGWCLLLDYLYILWGMKDVDGQLDWDHTTGFIRMWVVTLSEMCVLCGIAWVACPPKNRGGKTCSLYSKNVRDFCWWGSHVRDLCWCDFSCEGFLLLGIFYWGILASGDMWLVHLYACILEGSSEEFLLTETSSSVEGILLLIYVVYVWSNMWLMMSCDHKGVHARACIKLYPNYVLVPNAILCTTQI